MVQSILVCMDLKCRLHCYVKIAFFNKIALFPPMLGPLHTRDRGPRTNTLQALSLVEKAEPLQVHFTLRLRDQRSM